MNETAHCEIMKQLIDNTAEIIAATTDGQPESLSELAYRQKRLTKTLTENVSAVGPDLSPASLRGLQELVAKALDAVRIEMGQNRGNMLATGIKKKVLRAYGTVTVSNGS